MRSPIYVLAALAAAGIALFLAATPETQTASTAAVSPASADASETASAVLTDAGTLTLRVDGMHCEYGCYPTVKKTLESFDGVVSVELDEQPQAGALDNPQVVLTYQPGFDLAAAQSALAKNGFAKTSVVP
jgi:periplasmic mercuric ion binding protein